MSGHQLTRQVFYQKNAVNTPSAEDACGGRSIFIMHPRGASLLRPEALGTGPTAPLSAS